MNKTTLGILTGILSAVFVTGNMAINRYVFVEYDVDALSYTLFFLMSCGAFALLSIVVQTIRHRVVVKDIRRNYRHLLIIGLAGFIAVGMNVFGQKYTTATNISILATTNIVWTAVFSYFLLRERFVRKQFLWLVILFVGIYIGLAGFRIIDFHVGDFIVIGAAVFFGFGNVFIKPIMQKMKRPNVAMNVRLALGGLLALVVGLVYISDYSFLAQTWPYIVASGLMLWLFLKAFANTAQLLNSTDAIVLNNGQVILMPFVGVLLLNETYHPKRMIGAILVLVSIYFFSIRNKSAKSR